MSKRPWLPPVLNEIADAAGLDAALKLADARGGTRVYFPARAPDGHWLVDLVGREAADQLCAYYRSTMAGGSEILVPLGPKNIFAQKRLEAQSLYGRMSAAKVALQLGVCIRTVNNWWEQYRKPDDRQGNLF